MISNATLADVAELADALDLGSSSERSEGSSPFVRILNRNDPGYSRCRVTNYLSSMTDSCRCDELRVAVTN